VGQAAALYTELLVREDLLQLFGFPTLLEREWHRTLTTVQGVGAKAALAILGTLGVDGTARAISLGDAKSIQAAPGIGPKIAQRVVLELKPKAPMLMAMGGVLGGTAGTGADLSEVIEDPAPAKARKTAPPAPAGPNHQAEALSALQNLGYAPQDAASAVAQAADENAGADTAGLIRACLKLLQPKG
jgi:Holliday junction DNA helicase RuvA